MTDFNQEKLENILKHKQRLNWDGLKEKLNSLKKEKTKEESNPGESQGYEKELRESLKLLFGPRYLMLSKNGELIVLALVRLGDVDPRLTIHEPDTTEKEESTPDDHESGYRVGQKLVGYYRFEQVKIIIFFSD